MSGAEELRARLYDELARHRDTIELFDRDGTPNDNGELFRYGCTCGHERGVWTEREALQRLRESVDDQRLHVAGELTRVAEDYGRECAAAALEEAAADWNCCAFGSVARRHLRDRAAALKGSEEAQP